MPDNQKSETKPYPVYLYIILGASLFAFIQTFSLLSPILLSFLLIFLISLAFNPVILRMRALTGGRKGPTALIVTALVMVIALTGWAFFGPLKDSVGKISGQLPAYWERLQKPLIKMEQRAVLSEEKLQKEVTTEIAQTAEKEGNFKAMTQANKLTPAKNMKDSGSIRSSLSQMLQGVVSALGLRVPGDKGLVDRRAVANGPEMLPERGKMLEIGSHGRASMASRLALMRKVLAIS